MGGAWRTERETERQRDRGEKRGRRECGLGFAYVFSLQRATVDASSKYRLRICIRLCRSVL